MKKSEKDEGAMGQTRKQQHENIQREYKKTCDFMSYASLNCALLSTCAFVVKFGENMVDISQKIVDTTLPDAGWMDTAVLCCSATALVAGITGSLAYRVGMKITDDAYCQELLEWQLPYIDPYVKSNRAQVINIL